MVAFVLAALLTACPAQLPVEGPVVQPFAPNPPYGGHWGVDFEVPLGQPVVAPIAGRVGYVGRVAGVATVTIVDGPVKVSLSHLSSVFVERDTYVFRGSPLGAAGRLHGGLHVSLRIEGVYFDPMRLLLCRPRPPAVALSLLPRL